MSGYTYTDRDLLAVREDYFYSALEGPGFVDAWRDARMAVVETLAEVSRPALSGAVPYPADGGGDIATARLLDAMEGAPDGQWTARLIQRFEVTKRLYESYDGALRKGRGAAGNLAIYARFAAILGDGIVAGTRPPGGGAGIDLVYLNALLKLNDLICSQSAQARDGVAGWLRASLTAEIAAVSRLGERADD